MNTINVTDWEKRVAGVNRGHLLRVQGQFRKRYNTKIVVFEML